MCVFFPPTVGVNPNPNGKDDARSNAPILPRPTFSQLPLLLLDLAVSPKVAAEGLLAAPQGWMAGRTIAVIAHHLQVARRPPSALRFRSFERSGCRL